MLINFVAMTTCHYLLLMVDGDDDDGNVILFLSF